MTSEWEPLFDVDLKTCPFCGGAGYFHEAVLRDEGMGEAAASVTCYVCDIEIAGDMPGRHRAGETMSNDQAVERWNGRAT